MKLMMHDAEDFVVIGGDDSVLLQCVDPSCRWTEEMSTIDKWPRIYQLGLKAREHIRENHSDI